METVLFMIVWVGGATVHTLLELSVKSSKKCSAPGLLVEATQEKKSVKCRSDR